MEIEIHPAHCACRGALWLVTDEAAGKCDGPRGRLLPSTVRTSHAEWSAIGRPRTVDDYRRAYEEAVSRAARLQESELEALLASGDPDPAVPMLRTPPASADAGLDAASDRLMYLALANVLAAVELLEGETPSGPHAAAWVRARGALDQAHRALEDALDPGGATLAGI